MAKSKRKTNPFGEPMTEQISIRVTPKQKELISTAGTPTVLRSWLLEKSLEVFIEKAGLVKG